MGEIKVLGFGVFDRSGYFLLISIGDTFSICRGAFKDVGSIFEVSVGLFKDVSEAFLFPTVTFLD